MNGCLSTTLLTYLSYKERVSTYYFFYFSIKTYVVSCTHNIQSMFSCRIKKIIIFFFSKGGGGGGGGGKVEKKYLI